MSQLYAKQRSTDQMESNLIPMINIIFLLLIFFMIAGHLNTQNKPKKITLANAKSEQTVQPSYLNISITKNGQYYKAGQLINFDELKKSITTESQLTGINLQVDRQVTSGRLDEVLDVLRENNIDQVAIIVDKEAVR